MIFSFDNMFMEPSISFLFHFLLKATKNKTIMTRVFMIKPIVTSFFNNESLGNMWAIKLVVMAIIPRIIKAI